MDHVSHQKSGLNRREMLKAIAAIAGAGTNGALLVSRMGETILAQTQAGERRGAATAPTGTTLILLGTGGGPSVSLTRSQTASVVVTGGQPYLVDCGYGTVRALVQAGLRLTDIANIFVSHLHNDHTADIAALLSLKWTSGQTNPQPVAVWGPPGSKDMVDGAISFLRGDFEIRINDEGRPVRAENIFKGHDLSAPKITQVFKDERVTVQAVENTHFPDRAKEKMIYRSYAYRFNAADRSIVFSGDTAYSPALVELSRGADLFVCEAVSMATRRQQIETANRNAANTESIARHILETHSSTEEVGRMAAEAKVKTVVLYHLLGGVGQRGSSIEDIFIPDVQKFFDGPVIVGSDQTRI